ncbi:DeoR/GlpR family DNA-binding transcription regulator [Cellulophaga baltica]|uniref:DeoR/GlpR family DNA-binding transcription regulator n=1 Tax=Cellulophaga TaxID=104264 RepID=UPI001C07B924|nr:MULTISPECIES: DeoR/GlpR family DNA-binding transcription regulator [Cellulophaga]MBU2996480.1 DeoR/GlpR family DNA-binding transcription regulator [Cellulophaga baltica]MDO6767874.1 DeoR/GlpR family DNA-binding transcription regulator [Cellulophaga sp. 1_MG-2023]
MLKEERQQAILNEVELHNRVLLTDVAELLEVSIDTVRRDVKELDANSKLRKVHGGAVSMGFTNNATPNNNIYALADKILIAEKALTLLSDGKVIFIDGGTTCNEFVRLLPENLKITCFTISLTVALKLQEKPNVRVIFIGGEIAKESQIAIGANVIHNLSEIKVDYSFIGTGYVDSLYGLTEFDYDIVQVKKAVIKASKKTVLLCISEKLNSQHRYKTCDINAINTMITELQPENNLLNLFRNHDIRIL